MKKKKRENIAGDSILTYFNREGIRIRTNFHGGIGWSNAQLNFIRLRHYIAGYPMDFSINQYSCLKSGFSIEIKGSTANLLAKESYFTASSNSAAELNKMTLSSAYKRQRNNPPLERVASTRIRKFGRGGNQMNGT